MQPIINLETSEEIDHRVKIKNKIHFYYFKCYLFHNRSQWIQAHINIDIV